MIIEPRNKILMKTIRMKDLETLKLSLPKPCYQVGGSPGSPSKHSMHQLTSPLEQHHLPNLSGLGLQGGGNLSSRSRHYPEVQASVNGASYSLDHVRVPSDRFSPNDAPLRLGVPNKAKFIQLDGNFKRNLDAEGANAMRGKLNRNVDSTKGSGLNGLKSNINIQDPRNLSELPLVSNSHSVSKSPDGSRAHRLPTIPSKEVMDHRLPELSPDSAPQAKIQLPSGSEWVQAAQRIHPTKNHAAIKLKSVLQDLHQPALDSIDRESLKSPSMGHDRLGLENRPSSRDNRHYSNLREAQSNSNDPQRHKLSKLSLHGVLADERSKSFTHDHSEQPTSLLREAGEARNAQRRLSRKAHDHLQMIAQQTDTNARPPRLRLEAPIKANVSLNMHQHQILKGNPKVFATQAQSSTIDLEEADIKTPTSQLPRFRQNVLASNLLSQKKSPEFTAGGSGAGVAKKHAPSQTIPNQIDSLEQLVDQSKPRRSIRLGSEYESGRVGGGARSEPREEGLVESPHSREALEAALALDIGPLENSMKRNSSKVNTTAFSHTQAVELNLD